MEIWDAYDSKLNKIDGVTLVRGEEIPDGYFHLCGEIIVRHTDGSYLIMQRDKRERPWPSNGSLPVSLEACPGMNWQQCVH